MYVIAKRPNRHGQTTHHIAGACTIVYCLEIGDFVYKWYFLNQYCNAPMEHDKYRERFFHEQLLFGECYRISDTFGLHIGNGGLHTLHGKCRGIMSIP